MAWEGFEKAKKLKQYSSHCSHELNFFLFKRDRPFFEEIVLPFIYAKMEKSFIDLYLLSQNEKILEYSNKVMAFLDPSENCPKLNIVETCLAVEVALKKGNQDQWARARGIATSLISQQ